MPYTIEHLNQAYGRTHVPVTDLAFIREAWESSTSGTWSAGRPIGDSGWIEVATDRTTVFICTRQNWELATRQTAPGPVSSGASVTLPEHYDGERCPVCKSPDIFWKEGLPSVPMQVIITTACEQCGSEWDETYQLTGYANLETV